MVEVSRGQRILLLAGALLGVLVLTVGPVPGTALRLFAAGLRELAEAAGQRRPTLDEAEAVANVLLFVPLGAAGALLLRRYTGWVVVGLGVLSLAIEVLQASLPDRDPSYRDVVLNSGGALVGVLGVLAVRGLGRMTRRSRR